LGSVRAIFYNLVDWSGLGHGESTVRIV